MTLEFMLDTDMVSWALRGQGAVAARILGHRPSQLCISSITLAELRFGTDATRSRRLHRLVETFVSSVGVVPFDQGAADRFGPVANALAKKGEPIGTFDTLVFGGLHGWTAPARALERSRTPRWRHATMGASPSCTRATASRRHTRPAGSPGGQAGARQESDIAERRAGGKEPLTGCLLPQCRPGLKPREAAFPVFRPPVSI